MIMGVIMGVFYFYAYFITVNKYTTQPEHQKQRRVSYSGKTFSNSNTSIGIVLDCDLCNPGSIPGGCSLGR
jgi:hypothetical protein